MLEFPDTPSHEAYMPNFAEADKANKALGSKLWTTPGLDVNAEIDALVVELNGIFDAAEPRTFQRAGGRFLQTVPRRTPSSGTNPTP